MGRFRLHQPGPRGRAARRFPRRDRAEQFDRWKLEDRYIQAHVQKIIRANWKIVQEAFCESYHAPTTHPQTAAYLGDVNSQIDIWDNFARVITPGGTPSPLLNGGSRPRTRSSATCSTSATTRRATSRSATDRPPARCRRPPLASDGGPSSATWSTSGATPSSSTTSTTRVFPNFHPWGAYNRIVYRFRPNGNNHREAIMDVILLAPFSGERPPAATTTYLGADDEWTDAPRTRHARQGVLAGQLQHADGPEGPRDDGQARGDAGQLPGIEGALVARLLVRVGRGLTCSACDIRSPGRSTSRTATATCRVTTKDGRIGTFSVGGVDRGRGVRGRPAAVRLDRRTEGRPPPHPEPVTPDVTDANGRAIWGSATWSGRTSAGLVSATSTNGWPRPARRAWTASASTSSSTSACGPRRAARPPTSVPCSTGTACASPTSRCRVVGRRPRASDVESSAADRGTGVRDGRRVRRPLPPGDRVRTPAALDHAAEAFADLCDRAAEHGLLVGLEWLPYTNIADAADAQALVRLTDRPNAGYCVDIWHHTRGANDMAMITRARTRPGVLDPDERRGARAGDRRLQDRLPGQPCAARRRGVRLRRLHPHPADMGVAAPISLEVCSTELWQAPADVAAQAAADGMRPCWPRGVLPVTCR